jgi:hypothetical protein
LEIINNSEIMVSQGVNPIVVIGMVNTNGTLLLVLYLSQFAVAARCVGYLLWHCCVSRYVSFVVTVVTVVC